MHAAISVPASFMMTKSTFDQLRNLSYAIRKNICILKRLTELRNVIFQAKSGYGFVDRYFITIYVWISA